MYVGLSSELGRRQHNLDSERSENPEATFEEYQSATKFARWKYKYGLIVLIGCWIALLLICFLMIRYSKELATAPSSYIIEKYNFESCTCYAKNFKIFFLNETGSYYQGDLKKYGD